MSIFLTYLVCNRVIKKNQTMKSHLKWNIKKFTFQNVVAERNIWNRKSFTRSFVDCIIVLSFINFEWNHKNDLVIDEATFCFEFRQDKIANFKWKITFLGHEIYIFLNAKTYKYKRSSHLYFAIFRSCGKCSQLIGVSR